MNIQPDQHVKCVFKNGTVVEGIVRVWSKDEATLLSLNDDSLLVILHPSDDVMLVKIIQENLRKREPTESHAQEIADKIRAKAAENGQPEPDEQSLDAMTKAQLHIELADQERRVIAEKLRDHYPNPAAPKRKTYGYPQFFQKPRAK